MTAHTATEDLVGWPHGHGSTADGCVDAALACLGTTRLRNLTVEQVAAEAGLSRQTIYRYFGTKEGLLRAAVLREELIIFQRCRHAIESAPSLLAAIEVGVETMLTEVRSHPLVDDLLADDPETFLPYLTMAQGPVANNAGPMVASLLDRFTTHVPDDDMVSLAQMIGRLVVSFTIAPGDQTPREAARQIANLAAGRLIG